MVAEEGASAMKPLRTPGCRRSVICLLVSLTALVLVLLLPARGQDGSTSLEGMVEDLSGARIPRAEVTLLNPDNGFHSTIATDGEGRFSFAMLAPGRYTRHDFGAGDGGCQPVGLGTARGRLDAVAIPPSSGGTSRKRHGGCTARHG